jgi:Tol biopolymer transport system component
MRRALGLAALAALAAAASPTVGHAADDSHPVWSPDASVIVYSSTREPRGLHVVRPDGSGDGPLPHLPAVPQFSFSPDWFWIAFGVRDESSPMGQSLVVMRPDGSRARRLSDTLPGRLPAWSPAGNRIAFVRIGVHVPDLWLVAPDGSGLTGVIQAADEPAWSPDGRRIVRDQADRGPVAL